MNFIVNYKSSKKAYTLVFQKQHEYVIKRVSTYLKNDSNSHHVEKAIVQKSIVLLYILLYIFIIHIIFSVYILYFIIYFASLDYILYFRFYYIMYFIFYYKKAINYKSVMFYILISNQ